MSKKNNQNPVIKKIIICVVAFLLVTSVLGGGCATITGKLGLKDLFPDLGFIPLFPEDRESIDLDADETSSELESERESIKESESEPEKESQEAPDVSESVSSSGGSVVDPESEGVGPGESENPGVSGSDGESSGGAELPGGSESEGESSGGTELPGESESEKPGSSESESESPGISGSESESEKPGSSESESESGSESESESESESFPTDVVTYSFSGLDILNTGGTFTKDVVTINATSSSDMRLRTREIFITVEDGCSIVKVVLNCESNNTYEFTVEITPDGEIINFEGGIVEIVINGGTAYLQITFNKTVTVDSIDVSVST